VVLFVLQDRNLEPLQYLIFHQRRRLHLHARLVLMISSILTMIKMTMTGNAVVFFYISIVKTLLVTIEFDVFSFGLQSSLAEIEFW